MTKDERPLLIFDGDCGFCRFWVRYWHSITGDQVDYAPYQEVASRFPEIPSENFKRSVQLVLPGGSVFSGAHAVFRTLAYNPAQRWMLWAYRNIPGAASALEWSYGLVARNRGFFSRVTWLFVGRDAQPSSYFLARWLFLRLLGVIYFLAFLSLWTQVTGLIGAHGILPARELLDSVAQDVGPERYRLFPTLAWLDSSDASLKFLAGGGTLLSLLAIAGIGMGPVLALLWVFYLSLVTVGRDFLSFQWDILLLEAGFLAICFAPAQILAPPWKAKFRSPPSLTVLWLLRWLLFRLLLLSGAVKLLSGDPTWRNRMALNFHYWTQPLPTPIAWYAAQLPVWFQKLSVFGVFAMELGVPFLIFTPRRLRFIGAGLACSFQLLIALTGNYCFFNLLTIALCMPLLDDASLRRLFPNWIAKRIMETGELRTRWLGLRRLVVAPLALFMILLGAGLLASRFGVGEKLPRFTWTMLGWVEPFHIVNGYGLFAIMTTSRPEIVVEGSQDGQTWQAYEFKYKPGDIKQPPPWVAPHQPRLDWQMWFAALGSYQQSPWFINFVVRLLQGSPEVLALLDKNPFPNAPPRYVRAITYDYHFTGFASRRATGNWWQREFKGMYFPVASLKEQ